MYDPIGKTTDLEVIRKTPRRFTWGKITTIHDIGSYTFVEYVSKDRDNQDETNFHVYVDGKSTHNSTSTLEGAMVLAIANKNLEVNEARFMSMAACKVLGVKE